MSSLRTAEPSPSPRTSHCASADGEKNGRVSACCPLQSRALWLASIRLCMSLLQAGPAIRFGSQEWRISCATGQVTGKGASHRTLAAPQPVFLVPSYLSEQGVWASVRMAAGFSEKLLHGCSQNSPSDVGVADAELLAAWAEAATGRINRVRDWRPAHFNSCGSLPAGSAWMEALKQSDLSGPVLPVQLYLRLRAETLDGTLGMEPAYQEERAKAVGLAPRRRVRQGA